VVTSLAAAWPASGRPSGPESQQALADERRRVRRPTVGAPDEDVGTLINAGR
jgi:hypothetical protein